MNTPLAVVVFALGAIVLGAIAVALSGTRRTAHLKERFGTAHARATAAEGGKAEARLAARERRVERLQIRRAPGGPAVSDAREGPRSATRHRPYGHDPRRWCGPERIT